MYIICIVIIIRSYKPIFFIYIDTEDDRVRLFIHSCVYIMCVCFVLHNDTEIDDV